jgi:threonine dehydrogenase-like Zn-dependent dehydrogenase
MGGLAGIGIPCSPYRRSSSDSNSCKFSIDPLSDMATSRVLSTPQFHGATPISFSSLVVDEITVIGSRCGPFPRAIELLDAGRIDVEPLIAGVYPLEHFVQAFEVARRGLKVILRIH